MDKTILDIISYLISIMGVLGTIQNLSRYYFKTIYNKNITLEKKAEENKRINNNLIIYIIVGVAIQLFTLIFEDSIYTRLYSWNVYLVIALITTIITFFIYIIIVNQSTNYGRKKWFIDNKNTIEDIIKSVELIINSDYHFDGSKESNNPEQWTNNKLTSINRLNRLEEWLDINNPINDPDKRLLVIKSKFCMYENLYLKKK